MSRQTILITGASGELGHGLVKELASRDECDLVCCDLQEFELESSRQPIKFLQGDILDRSFLDGLFSRFSFDAIFHLAAILSTGGEKNPAKAEEVNVSGSFNLLERARRQSEQRTLPTIFMFPSTIAAYGVEASLKKHGQRVREEEFLQPITMYGINKRYVEELGRYFSTSCGMLEPGSKRNRLDFRALRYPGLLSADTVPTGGTSDYGPEMLHAAARGVPYSCFVNRETRLPFMVMPDAVKALLSLWRAPSNQLTRRVYNVGAFSVSAEEILAAIRLSFPKAIVDFKADSARLAIVNSWPEDIDDSVARHDWQWKPDYDLSRAFSEYLVPGVMRRYGSTQLRQANCGC